MDIGNPNINNNNEISQFTSKTLAENDYSIYSKPHTTFMEKTENYFLKNEQEYEHCTYNRNYNDNNNILKQLNHYNNNTTNTLTNLDNIICTKENKDIMKGDMIRENSVNKNSNGRLNTMVQDESKIYQYMNESSSYIKNTMINSATKLNIDKSYIEELQSQTYRTQKSQTHRTQRLKQHRELELELEREREREREGEEAREQRPQQQDLIEEELTNQLDQIDQTDQVYQTDQFNQTDQLNQADQLDRVDQQQHQQQLRQEEDLLGQLRFTKLDKLADFGNDDKINRLNHEYRIKIPDILSKKPELKNPLSPTSSTKEKKYATLKRKQSSTASISRRGSSSLNSNNNLHRTKRPSIDTKPYTFLSSALSSPQCPQASSASPAQTPSASLSPLRQEQEQNLLKIKFNRKLNSFDTSKIKCSVLGDKCNVQEIKNMIKDIDIACDSFNEFRIKEKKLKYVYGLGYAWFGIAIFFLNANAIYCALNNVDFIDFLFWVFLSILVLTFFYWIFIIPMITRILSKKTNYTIIIEPIMQKYTQDYQHIGLKWSLQGHKIETQEIWIELIPIKALTLIPESSSKGDLEIKLPIITYDKMSNIKTSRLIKPKKLKEYGINRSMTVANLTKDEYTCMIIDDEDDDDIKNPKNKRYKTNNSFDICKVRLFDYKYSNPNKCSSFKKRKRKSKFLNEDKPEESSHRLFIKHGELNHIQDIISPNDNPNPNSSPNHHRHNTNNGDDPILCEIIQINKANIDNNANNNNKDNYNITEEYDENLNQSPSEFKHKLELNRQGYIFNVTKNQTNSLHVFNTINF